jgi:hypothetical protein
MQVGKGHFIHLGDIITYRNDIGQREGGFLKKSLFPHPSQKPYKGKSIVFPISKCARSATNWAFERGAGGGSRLPRPFLVLFRDEREHILSPLKIACCYMNKLAHMYYR